jgi:predicted transcriptional regulator
MSTLTIRLPDDQHERLRVLASQRGVSLNKLFEEFSTKALTEFDMESRFRIRAARIDKTKGLAILDALDAKHANGQSL